MTPTMKVTRKQAQAIINQTFPEYKGRKVSITFSEKYTASDLNWDGGTRNYVKVVGATTLSIPDLAPWNNIYEGKTVELPPQILVVEHSYFCGQDCGLHIYANPAHMPKWLLA